MAPTTAEAKAPMWEATLWTFETSKWSAQEIFFEVLLAEADPQIRQNLRLPPKKPN
jgi:hypothetical protein